MRDLLGAFIFAVGFWALWLMLVVEVSRGRARRELARRDGARQIELVRRAVVRSWRVG